MYFKSCFVNTIITIKIEDNLLEVRSDNLSVITIVKDHVSNEANRLKIHFDLESEMLEQESVSRVLSQLHPIVEQ